MVKKVISFFAAAVLMLVCTTASSQTVSKLSQAKELYEKGLYEKASAIFEQAALEENTPEIQGYIALCAASMRANGYENLAWEFLRDCPWSTLAPQLRYRLALNSFDDGDYASALEQFSLIPESALDSHDSARRLFATAYSLFGTGDESGAKPVFEQVEALDSPDYSAPSRYVLGYISYKQMEFREAVDWFAKAASDPRFSEMSNYYLSECRFMLKDYRWMADNGPELLEKVPQERKEHLARMVSESFLILDDPVNAKKYYEMSAPGSAMARADYFYAGSIFYALEDYEGAIGNYSRMTERTDSIGQIANYQMGYSYIKTKNKVAALQAFKDASEGVDPQMSEDAFFNYAKLAFDLNNDPSAFTEYLNRYKDARKGDRIYGYMAVAALLNHDYASAVDAFNNIDVLDDDMKANYMKANYLRAAELVDGGAWRSAVPCLKATSYYAGKNTRLDQLSRFWLAESYFRDADYAASADLFEELYNVSALNGSAEYDYIPYSIAFCRFKEGKYDQAIKWFDEYLSGGDVKYRKGALLRKGDSYYMQKKYADAVKVFDKVLAQYPNVNDIYPYYQDAICYGLLGKDSRKIELLSYVLKAEPSSNFYSEAMFELGRSQVASGNIADAQRCYVRILDVGCDTTYMAKSLIELGMIARNASEYDNALTYYKRVVEKMPDSGYAEDALAAIESVYQARNEPYEYLAYVESVGLAGTKTEAQKETIIFNSAEQAYLSENYEKALVGLQNYFNDYPDGNFAYKGKFYRAECYKNLGQKEKACDCYNEVVESGAGPYLELAMLNFANLSYSLQNYDDAFGAYAGLYKGAIIESNKFTAVQGMMRSAYRGRRFVDAITQAQLLVKDNRATADDKREAKYIEAKSFMGMSQRDRAMGLLKELAASPKTAEGAEASYMLIQDSFDRGDFDATEKMVFALADSGTSHNYWLAKSFIVLGDAYYEKNDIAQAKATWESILNGYTAESPSDDVPDNVRTRLEKIQ